MAKNNDTESRCEKSQKNNLEFITKSFDKIIGQVHNCNLEQQTLMDISDGFLAAILLAFQGLPFPERAEAAGIV